MIARHMQRVYAIFYKHVLYEKQYLSNIHLYTYIIYIYIYIHAHNVYIYIYTYTHTSTDVQLLRRMLSIDLSYPHVFLPHPNWYPSQMLHWSGVFPLDSGHSEWKHAVNPPILSTMLPSPSYKLFLLRNLLTTKLCASA